MSETVPRTCTIVAAPLPDRDRMEPGPPKRDSQPLGDFRSDEAYVLLGDPGAGKTTAFKDEAGVLGDDAHVVSARDFLFPNDVPPEWRHKTLFIDGLDEVRAGEPDARTPFDRIRRRLTELERPRFRLSCREADWLGENDRRNLAKVSPGGQVTVLRLDPLTESDIKGVLASRADISDPEEFVSTARDRGVHGLLANPQTLDMLANVVGGGGEWPGSRLETFEQACLRIVREHNEEHKASTKLGDGPTSAQLLDASGRLCAVHLLTGTAGFSLLHDGDDVNYLSPDRCDYESPDVVRHALGTKLFKGQSDSRLTPIHRHIAEYLAAPHLARLVDAQKLPVRRVLALMEGYDGTVVTEMRGLSAWLAAQCPAVRPHLIDRDPIGVGQYGDVRGFTHQEKRTLLESLGRDLPRRNLEFGVAASFRTLATPDMEAVFRDVLSSRSRDTEQQLFIGFVLQVLMESASLPGLSESLLRVVRCAKWWPSVRKWALDAYCLSYHGQDKPDVLRALLKDTRRGDVADPDDDLLGTLLEQLYPQELSPRELWEFFSRPQNPDHFGRYRWFWEAKLVNRSPDAHVVEHLDRLSQEPRRSQALLHVDSFRRLRLGLVARGLAVHGDNLVDGREITRLYDWLGVASVRDRYYLGDRDEIVNNIREWLVARPQVQKAVILEGLKHCPDDDAFGLRAREVQERLYRSSLPPDFGLWCLNEAVSIEHEAPRVAEDLLERAFRALDDDRINQDLSLHRIQEGTRDSDRLKTVLARLKRPRTVSALETELAEEVRQYESQRREERARELDYLRSQKAVLLDNRAPPGLLYQLARIYFADFKEIAGDKGTGARAIEARCAGDRLVVEAILSSFRGVLSRKDVPTLKEVVRACRENRIYHLGLPFLAGLAEVERTQSQTLYASQFRDHDDPISLGQRTDVPTSHVNGRDVPEDTDAQSRTRADKPMHLAVAFYFTTIHGAYRPSWYQMLLDEHPEMVADVQVRIASAALRGDHAVDCKLYELAFDQGYARVASWSALRLLRSFPTQCKRKCGQQLDYLLLAALQHSDRAALRELIGAKLSRSSLRVWQRVRWLATGLFAWPDSFADALRDHVKERENRLAELSAFLSRAGHVAELVDGLKCKPIALLIRLLGSSVEPERFEGSSGVAAVTVTSTMARSRLVGRLIHRLASSPSPEASEMLKDLTEDEAVPAWQDELRRAREAQRIVRRDEGYRHPDLDQVCRTLRGAEPANVADLAALVADHLCEIAVDIRRGSEDGWEPFWNQGSLGRRTEPKRENSCRNGIAKELKLRLPSSIEISLEAHHAREKRSDLRVSYVGPANERFHVPVEIKRSQHRDLWTSIDDQLVRKYTIDPEARGYGVYLVLWFGKEHTQPSPDGSRPGSPEELEDRLRDTLSVSQARKISVCVIDVSGGAPVAGGYR